MVRNLGRKERRGLLTANELRSIHEFDLRVDALLRERERLRRQEGYHQEEIYQISRQIAILSRNIAKLQRKMENKLPYLIDELNAIVNSNSFQQWAFRQLPRLNTIASRLGALNKLKIDPFSLDYEHKRIESTKSQPRRYWLNEHYVERKERNLIAKSNSIEYALIGLKEKWTSSYYGRPLGIRGVLRRALELEERYYPSKILSRTKEDTITIKEIYERILTIEQKGIQVMTGKNPLNEAEGDVTICATEEQAAKFTGDLLTNAEKKVYFDRLRSLQEQKKN